MVEKISAEDTVLVVGAGPVGLLMASELARHGVPVRVIDKAPAASDKSKALGVHARSLEMLENIGIVESFLAAGINIYGVSVYCEGKRIVHLGFDELKSPYPFVLMIPQSKTESILSEHLAHLGYQIERNVELIGFSDEQEQVIATLRHADGLIETMPTPWLIGCDGAHSTVRHILGLPFAGAQYQEVFGLADVKVDWTLPEDEMHTFLSEEGPLVFFPFGSGRYRVMAEATHDMDTENAPSLKDFQALVDRRCSAGATLSDPHWLTWFKFHCRSVSRLWCGRVFLAGDAAHIHSPVGGQGMNTGMHTKSLRLV